MDKIGKYEVLDKIGSGGFAVVYKGYDPFIKRPVAIKVCYSRDEETRKRFHREAEIAGRLVHRNITAVYDFGLHEQMPYLVEEYLPGEDLAHMIRRREPEALEEKIDFLLQIASGLGYAHSREVIHRDIKPSNIRILDNGRAKIMDFGTAKLANVESNLTQTGMTLGTVAYLSPERLLGKPSGTNSDLFSYGVLAYELLSFRRPFIGRNIPNLIDQVLNASPVPLADSWPECPSSLAVVVHKCLSKDPSTRYASCLELSRDLEQVRAEHCSYSEPMSDTVSTAVPINLKLSGLLEHARELLQRGKRERASILLDEVLEMAPDHLEAKRLLASCRAPEAADPEGTATIVTRTLPEIPESTQVSTHTATWEAPEERQSRKVREAVTSIESYVKAGKLVAAIEALEFATQFLGEFGEAKALQRRIVETARSAVDEVKKAARSQASNIATVMTDLRRQKLLKIQLAEQLVARIQELDPEDLAGRHVLAALHQDARQRVQNRETQDKEHKRQEAIESIEKLLREGDPEMAERALRFAVHLFGEFDQIPQLEQRISAALKQSRD
ncbi:MAG: protein kinase [Acidobacteriota bacterium]